MRNHWERHIPVLAITVVLWIIFSKSVFAQTTFQSGPEQTSLVELFTSEGCSSCPPADARISEFLNDPNLWITFVPVSFHVDYWNGLGWQDRFAQNEFTERQRAYAKRWSSSYLYTPSFVLDGAEWKEWYQKGMFNQKKANIAGHLRVDLSNTQASVSFNLPNHEGESFNSYFVISGFGVESSVNRGENSGKKLSHNFIALDYQEQKMRFDPDQKIWTAKILIPVIREPMKRKAISVWVSKDRDPTPIQAVGGFTD